MSTHPTPPRNWWILGMQDITDNLKQTTQCYIPEDLLLTLSPWRSVFVYGSWNGFAQPWYRVWPSMVVPSRPLQSHNDDWSTFTPALSARSRPSRNVIPLGAFEQSGEAPVCFIMSVRPPFCLNICSSLRLSEYTCISSISSAWISVKKINWWSSVTNCREDSYLGKIGQKTTESLHEDHLHSPSTKF
jgi:hypothetical protein